MKCVNIPIFVSHRGCPFQCSFCNQQEINGECRKITASDVIRTVEEYLPTLSGKRAEIAFFGGSFTGIPVEEQEELLSAAYTYVKMGKVEGIRLSTRPDYIDEEVMARLKSYGVTAVELGAQSMDDEVLTLAGRGHSAEDVKKASRMIRESGMELGLQMMIGLLGDTPQKAKKTAEEIIKLSPKTVRIYPCLVMKNTPLEKEYSKGMYEPLSLEDAVSLTADLKEMYGESGILVIRMGLQPSESLEQSLVAGPYHPAFGELVKSRLFYRKMEEVLMETSNQEVRISCPDHLRSIVVGQRKENIRKLEEKFNISCHVECAEELKVNERRVEYEI